MLTHARRWEDEETAPPLPGDKPTFPMRLAKFQRWARLVSTCPEKEIAPFDPEADYGPEPVDSGMMPVTRAPMRPRVSSSGLFHALRVKS